MSVFDGLGKKNSGNGGQGGVTFQDALKQVTDNPAECFRAAGVNVPNEIMHDQQKTVMHLIRTNQVRNPMMQQLLPMIQRMNTMR